MSGDGVTSTLTDAETLRAAAAKLRETAAPTTTAPWYEDPGPSVYAHGTPDGHCPNVARYDHYQDAVWGALAGPQIAEPLAAWLESEADHLDDDLRPLRGLRMADAAAVAVATNYDPALRLARTILTGVDPEDGKP